jgi:predicted Zn finger-like uncharacterized protein
MVAANPASVEIACPKCGTRYRLPRETLGVGRTVQCASCKTAWDAHGDAPQDTVGSAEDALFDPAAETQLDAVFEALDAAATDAPAPPEAGPQAPSPDELKRALAPQPKPKQASDPRALRKQHQAFSRRQANIRRKLPMGRLRRSARAG